MESGAEGTVETEFLCEDENAVDGAWDGAVEIVDVYGCSWSGTVI
jgi:hypothetical protein